MALAGTKLVSLVKESAMSDVVSLYDAKIHLSHLIDRAAHGEERTITNHGRAMVRLMAIPFAEKPKRVQAGALGVTFMSDDLTIPCPRKFRPRLKVELRTNSADVEHMLAPHY